MSQGGIKEKRMLEACFDAVFSDIQNFFWASVKARILHLTPQPLKQKLFSTRQYYQIQIADSLEVHFKMKYSDSLNIWI